MDNSNVLDKCSPVVPRIGRRNNNYDIRITRKNANKTEQKENTSQQTHKQKMKKGNSSIHLQFSKHRLCYLQKNGDLTFPEARSYVASGK